MINDDIIHILLADDDEDDQFLFKDAIRQIKVKSTVTTVNDGEQLMDYLYTKNVQLPNLIFLDLNMPKKNGIECLDEIRSNSTLNDISIAIYSTSASEQHIEETF